ncbi:MAG: glutathione S-transferase N-terminal domain-containing protein, partial [Proteobacteria bacterium]|nr:glutathione S-transferase N-terminal domain-containing protein [Pseudomonadota bacterium]
MNPITLYQAPTRPWSSPNLSPFCVKLECYLRMVELPHTIAPMNRGKAPKGKIPYVDLGDGRLLGDSQLIIEHLEKTLVAAGKPSLDAGLSTTEAATSQLLRRTLEEGTYFAGMYLRWATDDGYAVVKEEFKKFVPGLVLPIIRRDIKKRLVGQGSGRHTRAEI